MKHTVCRLDELPAGSRRIVEVRGVSIGVLNVGGALYALRNRCPHRGAPLCLGRVGGTMLPSDPGTYRYDMDGLVLRCPWHRYEFDVRTGRSPVDPHGLRVRTYPVRVEDGSVVLDL